MRNVNDFQSSDSRFGGFGADHFHTDHLQGGPGDEAPEWGQGPDSRQGFGRRHGFAGPRGGFPGMAQGQHGPGRGFDRMGGGGRRDRAAGTAEGFGEGFDGFDAGFGAFPQGDDHREGGRGNGPRGGRPGFGGPDFGGMPGFGPGFGGPMGGPRGGRGGRGPGRGRKGDVRNAILALLKDQPMNGYQLITAISEKSEGLWSPSAGSVYPALGLLTDEGLIRETQADGKKVSELTEAGREYVEQHADELDAPWQKVAGPHRGFLDMRPEVGQLAMAVQQVAMQGDQAQIEAVRGILDRARKDIYRLLAGDTVTE